MIVLCESAQANLVIALTGFRIDFGAMGCVPEADAIPVFEPRLMKMIICFYFVWISFPPCFLLFTLSCDFLLLKV